MNLHRLLLERAQSGNPVRVGLIGAGKFGSMFLSQVPTHAGAARCAAIVDLAPARARDAMAGRLAGDDRRRPRPGDDAAPPSPMTPPRR